MDADLEATFEQVLAVTSLYGLSVVGAIVILIIGFWFAGFAARLTDRALAKREKVDATLRHFFAGLVRYGIIAFTIIAVLDQFGVETTSLIALAGAAGLAIGLALQGTLSNVAAGVMVLLFRPFRVGQFVEAGSVMGTVERINLFTTDMNTPDNVHIVVPNNELWGQAIKNYSHNPTRRMDIVVGIDYGDDIGLAFDTIKTLIDGDERVLAEPAPQIMVSNLGDNSVDITIRLWANGGDFWPLRWDLIRGVKEALDKAGITIPFPQRTVHLEKADAE